MLEIPHKENQVNLSGIIELKLRTRFQHLASEHSSGKCFGKPLAHWSTFNNNMVVYWRVNSPAPQSWHLLEIVQSSNISIISH